MIQCPLLEKPVPDNTCSKCMYLGPTEHPCLYTVVDTRDFAQLRGVKHHEIERERMKAENRIQLGLCLSEYLEWFKDSGECLSFPLAVLDVADSIIKGNEVLSTLNVSSSELSHLVIPDTWQDFQDAKGCALEFRLSHVLFITSQQSDELFSAITI